MPRRGGAPFSGATGGPLAGQDRGQGVPDGRRGSAWEPHDVPADRSQATANRPQATPPGPDPTGDRRPARETRGSGEGQGQARTVRSPLTAGPSAMSLTAEELARASGLSPDALAELERYGLMAGRPMAGTVYYDEECFAVATLAAAFAQYGIEARHLRMYRTAADREASFLEQIVMPLLKQRNPESRRRALDDLAQLAGLGQRLRASLLRVALREHTGG